MKALLIACLILLVTMALSQPTNNVELNQKWKDFKLKHNRQFASEEEELMRKNIFAKTVEMVEKHNLKYQQGLTTFTMAINQFADRTSEEMNFFTGLRMNKKNSKVNQYNLE